MSTLNEDGRGRSLLRKWIKKGGKAKRKYSITISAGIRESNETVPQEAPKLEKTRQQNRKKKGIGAAKNRAQKEERAGTSQLPDHTLSERTDIVLENREEKLQLEQAIAGVVGSPTGLLAALDVMVYDTKEKNLVGFRCHAEGYFWRLNQLQLHLKRYQEVAPEEELDSAPLYRELLAEGDSLKKTLEASEDLTDKDLDSWRENMLRHIHLYDDEEGHYEP